MAKGKNQYAVPTQGGWAVKGEGSSQLTVKTDNKADALKIGKEIAKNQQSELTFLGKDGKIQNKIVTETTHFHQRTINME